MVTQGWTGCARQSTPDLVKQEIGMHTIYEGRQFNIIPTLKYLCDTKTIVGFIGKLEGRDWKASIVNLPMLQTMEANMFLRQFPEILFHYDVWRNLKSMLVWATDIDTVEKSGAVMKGFFQAYNDLNENIDKLKLSRLSIPTVDSFIRELMSNPRLSFEKTCTERVIEIPEVCEPMLLFAKDVHNLESHKPAMVYSQYEISDRSDAYKDMLRDHKNKISHITKFYENKQKIQVRMDQQRQMLLQPPRGPGPLIRIQRPSIRSLGRPPSPGSASMIRHQNTSLLPQQQFQVRPETFHPSNLHPAAPSQPPTHRNHLPPNASYRPQY